MIKRCPNCQLCPLPSDIEYFFGNANFTYCRQCRGEMGHSSSLNLVPNYTGKARPAIVLICPKLYEMPPELIKECLLPPRVRDAIKLREYRNDVFVCDGEDKLWRWCGFPYNRNQPMDWETFLKRWTEYELYQPTDDPVGMKILETDPEEEEPTMLADVPYSHLLM